MAAKKTIAIIGATEKSVTKVAGQLAQANYRLLLVSDNNFQPGKLSGFIRKHRQVAEIERIDCAKDGCWEADIIMLAIPVDKEKEIVEKIKEVATQKIVAVLLNNENDVSFISAKELQRLLPHSKTAAIFISPEAEVFITSDDDEATETLSNIFKTAGFNPVVTGKEV